MADLEEILDQLPAYAVGALDEDEARQVDEFLANCRLCLAEAAAYRTIQQDLALAAPDAAPSADLKRRLMSRIRLTMADALPEPPAETSPTPARKVWPRLKPAWMWLSAALILLLLLTNLWSWRQWRTLSEARARELMQTVTLAGTDAAPGANGVVVLGHYGRDGAILVDSLPPLDDAHQYQLWLVKDQQRTSGALFSVGQWGSATACVSAPESIANYTSFDVSVEPVGGSAQPTGKSVLGGKLY